MAEPIVYTEKDMEYQEAKISFFENRISELEEELEYVRTIKDSAERTLKEEQDKVKRYEKEEDRLREENRKLKLHIEAKDKAYTDLLKDYEELKEDNKRLRVEIEEWLNAVRKSLEK